MIKFNGEYLDFNDTITVERQIKNIKTLKSAGDFSYSFTMPDTANNRRILNIKHGNSTSRTIYQENDTVIESFDGTVYRGSLRVEGIKKEGIAASFFSGNTNWFSLLTGNINQIDMSANKQPVANTDPSQVIVDSWSATEWITYPIINKGLLDNWSTGYLRTEEFMPFVYIKNIFIEIFRHNGLKVDGEIFKDALFNNLIAGSNSTDSQIEYIKAREVFAGKNSNQPIGTSPVTVTFPIETFPYYDGSKNNFDGTKYTADVDMWGTINLLLNIDTNVTYTLKLKINGVIVDTKEGTSTQIVYDYIVNNDFPSNPVITLSENDYAEIDLTISSGTANITDGWFKFKLLRLLDTYPQFLLAQTSQADFVSSIFTMFNVISTYDTYTKTVTCDLFRNILNKEEQDLSEYLQEYEHDFITALEDYGKKNVFSYQQGDQEEIESFNNLSPVPYGSGVIEPDNVFLKDNVEHDVIFTNSFYSYSNILKAYLMNLGLVDISDNDEPIAISSAALGTATRANFTTAVDHGFEQLDYVWITDTSTGDYVGIGRIAGVGSTTTFEIQRLFFTTTVTGNVKKIGVREAVNENVYLAVNIPNYPISSFSNSSTIRYGNADRSSMAYAFFIKTLTGLDIDNQIESPAFSDPNLNGYNNITLIDKNYQVNKRIVDNPDTVIGRFIMPKNVFDNLDQKRPIRLKTNEFNALFFAEKITGFVDSNTPFTIDLVKIL